MGAVHIGSTGCAGVSAKLALGVLVEEVAGQAGCADVAVEAGVAVTIAGGTLTLIHIVADCALGAAALVAVGAVLRAGQACSL